MTDRAKIHPNPRHSAKFHQRTKPDVAWGERASRRYPSAPRACYTRSHTQQEAAIKQLIYRSRPFGFDQATLDGILIAARRNNRDDGITGALICRQDMYIQLIEGPDDAIDALFARISADDRHTEIKLEVDEPVEERMFPEWAMLADTNPSMTFSQAEVEDGAMERASTDTLRGLFQRIADQART